MLPIDMLHNIARERQHTLRQEAERDRLVRSARAAKRTAIQPASYAASSAGSPERSGDPARRPNPLNTDIIPLCQSVQLV